MAEEALIYSGENLESSGKMWRTKGVWKVLESA